MADDFYTCGPNSDGVIAAGRNYASNRAVIIGDSLTDEGFGALSTFWYINALDGGKLKLVSNLGVQGNTVADVIARIDNSYANVAPGMLGLSNVGWVILRIGTNNTRGGASINATVQAQYAELISKILVHAKRVIVMAVPPIGPPDSGAGVNSYNTWLSSFCEGIPNVVFINDTIMVNNGSGGWATGYQPPDGVHYGSHVAHRMAIDGAAEFGAAISSSNYPSPIRATAVDTYPDQWVTNHEMTGSSGINTLGGGLVPTSWTVSSYGGGWAATTQIVAADGVDENQAPWLRVTPAQVSNSSGAYLYVNAAMLGRAITESDPEFLDMAAEIRFNSFDSTKFASLRMAVNGSSNEVLSPPARIFMGDAVITGKFVVRSSLNRKSRTLSHASSALSFSLYSSGVYSGLFGSFDIRSATVRG